MNGTVQCRLVPVRSGHEIVGRVVKTGRDVKKFKEGDTVGVGCMVNSCGVCVSCVAGDEQFCVNFPTLTYNAEDKILGGVTYGGYSENIIVRDAFVLRSPTSWIWLARLRCFARELRLILRCGTGTSAKDRKLELWVWEG